jgi:transcriptional regulator with XRE-family HTH domain
MEARLDVKAFQESFGKAVRRRRQAIGISQEELASRCELHRTYISEIERGLKSASLKAILAISHALGCPPHVLIREAEEYLKEVTQ